MENTIFKNTMSRECNAIYKCFVNTILKNIFIDELKKINYFKIHVKIIILFIFCL